MGLPPWDQRSVRQSWWQGIRGPEPAGVLARSISPTAADQTTVPGQQCSRGDDPMLPQLAWQGTDQRGPIAIAMKRAIRRLDAGQI